MANWYLWYFTSDPLSAVIILPLVDVLGFAPTARKAFSFPFDEDLRFFFIFMLRNLIVILALEQRSLTTVLFPATIAAACFSLIVMVLYRRKVVS